MGAHASRNQQLPVGWQFWKAEEVASVMGHRLGLHSKVPGALPGKGGSHTTKSCSKSRTTMMPTTHSCLQTPCLQCSEIRIGSTL